MTDQAADGRRARGALTRALVLRAAVDHASVDGLDGLSFGRLADATGLSKAGIQTLFGTKQALQLATVEFAARLFAEAVIAPTTSTPTGVARLRALIDGWLDYAERPLFTGGCFWGATLPEQDSRPGSVRDAVVRHRDQWIQLLARELAPATGRRRTSVADAELAAFELDAVLNAANTAFRLGDPNVRDRVHRTVDRLVGAAR